MRWSFLLALLFWVLAAGHAKPETSTTTSEVKCPRPELLFPCQCEIFSDKPLITCNNIKQSFDLKTVFNRFSTELPKEQDVFLNIQNSTGLESIESNSTGSVALTSIHIESVENLVKLHEEAFVGTEHRIIGFWLDTKSYDKTRASKWQPNLPYPYNWLGLINRMKSLNFFRIHTRGPLTGGNFLHLPTNALRGHDKLHLVMVEARKSLVTIASRAFSGCRRLNYVVLSPINRVPAEIVADLSPPEPDEPLYQRPFRLRLVVGNITETSFDPRAFVGNYQRPVHLDLFKNPIQTLPEPVFRPFFDGHPDNLVNIADTKVDSRTPDNAWWTNNDLYKLKVVNFSLKDMGELGFSAFPIEKLGRVNKYKFEYPTADNSNTRTTAPTPTRLPRSRIHQKTDLVDDLFMEFDDGDDILF